MLILQVKLHLKYYNFFSWKDSIWGGSNVGYGLCIKWIIYGSGFASVFSVFQKNVVFSLDQRSSSPSWADKLGLEFLQGQACDIRFPPCHEFPEQDIMFCEKQKTNWPPYRINTMESRMKNIEQITNGNLSSLKSQKPITLF